jgi:acylphosphatase
MKAKILITGPKVHDVGYRYYLLSLAMSRKIRKFEANNIEGDKEQEIEALVDGNDDAVRAFIEAVKSKYPALAKVSGISFAEYTGDVMKIGEYSQFCTTVQMSKAIPVLLNISNDLIEMKGDLKTVAENTDAIAQIRQIQEDIRAIKARLGMA